MLDSRLSACAELVRKGSKLVDVGTDHAYLPIWVAQNNIISSAVASDVREKPLMKGLENIKKYNCENIVSVRLSDGLDNIEENEADDIVISGMGAELIVKIMQRTPWIKNPDKRFILQPMTKTHILREYLCKNGFEIISETPCSQNGKYYTVIYSEYSGEKYNFAESFFYMGKLDCNNENSKKYMRSVFEDVINKKNGFEKSGQIEKASNFQKIIDDIKTKYNI